MVLKRPSIVWSQDFYKIVAMRFVFLLPLLTSGCFTMSQDPCKDLSYRVNHGSRPGDVCFDYPDESKMGRDKDLVSEEERREWKHSVEENLPQRQRDRKKVNCTIWDADCP